QVFRGDSSMKLIIRHLIRNMLHSNKSEGPAFGQNYYGWIVTNLSRSCRSLYSLFHSKLLTLCQHLFIRLL
ncbi:hypothetical protein L9F63_015520, partial [Diploptera punctata]